MINKIKKSLNKITVGEIFIAGLLMLPMTLIFPENIMCGYMSALGAAITFATITFKLALFFIWFIHLTFLMSMRGTTERAEIYISDLKAEHLKSGKEIFFRRSK
ncbi:MULTISPECIES: hypothetical protein [Enterobacterales]|jgi:hypothetical protein|uniref:Conjugal transfer protein n=1 Tax=Klebsiella michiganensis TaxID=1134687 RepID=A0AB35WKG2_9ENTR|nr:MULTISPECIES: hypothetical protein [Enterobacterales]EAO1147675.1 hypothetical protein [Salmonella enterica]ECV6407780.1 hypothetical protein [Salmonella enterica subsp. enterica serovar Thompson]EDC9061301.1 hypothetical protein [Salmonella enterica subsp. enterica serovar Typhimurium]EDT3000333.1 hypothetical protein [Salmonella enterica subsp. houtenae]EDU5237576.1 hypothetical protein [Salmonella enterica subsp. enterica serovar Braenderup]EED4044155.1 hypothetical protein [Salmonella 